MVRVSVSETYDLSTKTGKMSLIGVHTPSLALIKRTYGGMLENFKYMKFAYCDVKLACASVLPADPLQVGVSAGKIAPQDMFNPILYKAVSNEAMNVFELRMQGLRAGYGDDSTLFQGSSIDKTDDVADTMDETSMYYSLLSNRKGWKIAHPQAGLSMKGLRPLVYEKLYNVGDSPTFNDNLTGDWVNVVASGSSKGIDDPDHAPDQDEQLRTSVGNELVRAHAFRGRSKPMPAIPTVVLSQSGYSESKNAAYGGGTLAEAPGDRDILAYTGLIIMPPAELNKFYYRLVVRWYLDFLAPRPLNEIAEFSTMIANAQYHYGCDYTISGSKLNMVDSDVDEIKKVMEGI